MAEQRSGGASADHGGRAAPEHVLVVFPGYHRPWAAWINQRLDTHGVRATLQRWDPPREVPLEDSLGDLLLARGQVLLVLDDWFFELGPRPAGEWNDVLRGFVASQADRFAAVNLTNRTLLPSTAVLEPVSLWGVGEEEAEARLLSRLGIEPRRSPARRIAPGALVRYPETPPDIWGEVPRRNPRFTGRDDLLTELQERLMDAERGNAAYTLLGMSGIGKTQIAAEYAHRFSSDYDVIWWVSSDDRNVQRDRLGELAVALELPTGSEPGERIRAVREALRRGAPHGRWLVVFDGWDDIRDVDVMVPQGPGHVLITSRNHGWREHTDVLPVRNFDRAESTGYLMRRAPHITAAEADEVAAEFGDVPLPLVQAAAWLGESGMEASEYLRMVPDDIVEELLWGMLGADELGFHTWGWASTFISCCSQRDDPTGTAQGVWPSGDPWHGVEWRRYGVGKGRTRVRAYPLGVDGDELRALAHRPEVDEALARLRAEVGERRTIVRVDRTELSKNILRGLLAYRELLTVHPEWRDRVVHLASAYPSRQDLESYRAYTASVTELAAEINAEFGTADWQPVIVSVEDDFTRSLAAYRLADVALVNPVRDGMNLVAKEIPVVSDAGCALVLSTGAGAYKELREDVLAVNPFDVSETAEALHSALTMPRSERADRTKRLAATATALPPQRWFLNQLDALREENS
ncbi:trehalose-6-phosphate synthase [Streptomyces aureus]|uniref:trehalose-6-phosphate synthase n=1 Tax=Streptomyces aureus TaxID=193461 RepID=UPI0006E41379|nr:trehalose-6-phosphate synthase [Streptomyces aureus]